jgi:hypothetical protein
MTRNCRRANACAVLLVTVAAVVAAGCGSEEPRARPLTDAKHHAKVAKDPYRLTCDDIARQPLNSTNQRLVIDAEFALAKERVLRERVEEMTGNRVGRSVYWALTEICKHRPAGFEPGREAVDAVRRGKYLVQPRPKSWSRPELWWDAKED